MCVCVCVGALCCIHLPVFDVLVCLLQHPISLLYTCTHEHTHNLFTYMIWAHFYIILCQCATWKWVRFNILSAVA